MWTLPILCWFLGLLFLIRRGVEWRAAFLLSSVVWGCLVTVFTEFLSFFTLLTFGGLALCWAAATVVAVLLNFPLKKPWPVWRLPRLSVIETGFIGGIALICLATFIIAIVSPPNNWDSMTYHMSRVMHWLQNRSVAHYPTHILRQIDLNPWAEFAITQFQALSGGDRYANLVQWFSLVGSIVGASLIAKQLSGDRRAQLFSAVVVATIPMGILQSSSTQNDYVVAFWLICLAWSGLEFIRSKELPWALIVGACLGLAVLTKGTAYLYAFPFVVWLAFSVFRSAPRRGAIIILCLVIPFILLNGVHYQRNLKLFSNPLTSGGYGLSNEPVSASALVSNLLRNSALQLPSPFSELNNFVQESVTRIHEGLNIDVNNPKTTYPETEFEVGKLVLHEDLSGNFLHALMVVASLLTLPFFLSFRKIPPTLFGYVAAVTAGYFLFCLVLKWQPWHSRLLLPLFVLGAPGVGVIAKRCWANGLVTLVALLLLTAALPWTFGNVSRPLLQGLSSGKLTFPLFEQDRNQLYFMNRRDLYSKYVQTAADIRRLNPRNIGLILSGDAWEYPLWVLLKEDIPAIHIEHFGVENVSRSTRAAYIPDYTLKIE